MKTREQALAWWEGLTHRQKLRMIEKHMPKAPFFEFVNTSSSRIEAIWSKENPNI